MDPITATHLVHDRTLDLQRTADKIRQERALRRAATAELIAPSGRPAEVRRSPTKACGPSPVEHAT